MSVEEDVRRAESGLGVVMLGFRVVELVAAEDAIDTCLNDNRSGPKQRALAHAAFHPWPGPPRWETQAEEREGWPSTAVLPGVPRWGRSEEHTSELQSPMRI